MFKLFFDPIVIDKTMRYITWYERRTDVDPKFMAWIDKVETMVYAQSGCYLLELADEPYYDWFVSGESVEYVAQNVLENNFTL